MRSVAFVATQPIAAGEQALWTYGNRSNDYFLVQHGFVPAGGPNAQDDLVLFDSIAHLTAWLCGNATDLLRPGLTQQQAAALAGRRCGVG